MTSPPPPNNHSSDDSDSSSAVPLSRIDPLALSSPGSMADLAATVINLKESLKQTSQRLRKTTSRLAFQGKAIKVHANAAAADANHAFQEFEKRTSDANRQALDEGRSWRQETSTNIITAMTKLKGTMRTQLLKEFDRNWSSKVDKDDPLIELEWSGEISVGKLSEKMIDPYQEDNLRQILLQHFREPIAALLAKLRDCATVMISNGCPLFPITKLSDEAIYTRLATALIVPDVNGGCVPFILDKVLIAASSTRQWCQHLSSFTDKAGRDYYSIGFDHHSLLARAPQYSKQIKAAISSELVTLREDVDTLGHQANQRNSTKHSLWERGAFYLLAGLISGKRKATSDQIVHLNHTFIIDLLESRPKSTDRMGNKEPSNPNDLYLSNCSSSDLFEKIASAIEEAIALPMYEGVLSLNEVTKHSWCDVKALYANAVATMRRMHAFREHRPLFLRLLRICHSNLLSSGVCKKPMMAVFVAIGDWMRKLYDPSISRLEPTSSDGVDKWKFDDACFKQLKLMSREIQEDTFSKLHAIEADSNRYLGVDDLAAAQTRVRHEIKRFNADLASYTAPAFGSLPILFGPTWVATMRNLFRSKKKKRRGHSWVTCGPCKKPTCYMCECSKLHYTLSEVVLRAHSAGIRVMMNATETLNGHKLKVPLFGYLMESNSQLTEMTDGLDNI